MGIPSPGNEVTVEEVDKALGELAARCPFSNPAVRAHTPLDGADRVLSSIFHRLQSRDAKWFTRVLLKSYQPVVLPEHFVLQCYHFLLPPLLRFQSDFEAAAKLLRGPLIGGMPPRPSDQDERERLRKLASAELVPRLGVKVGRPTFLKARVLSKLFMDDDTYG